MKIKLRDLKKNISETLKYVGEEIAVDADGTIDLADPTIIWNDLYNLDDQPSFVKMALASINYDLPPTDNEYGMEVDQETATLLGKGARKKGNVKLTSYGNDIPWSIDRYAKNVSKYPAKADESVLRESAWEEEDRKRQEMNHASMAVSSNPHFDARDHFQMAKTHKSLARKQSQKANDFIKKGDSDKAQYHLGKQKMHADNSIGHYAAAKFMKGKEFNDKRSAVAAKSKDKGKL